MTISVRFGAALTLVLASHAPPALAEPLTFKFASGESKVQFVSDAPLERITGATTRVAGELTLDPAAPAAARGSIRVPVASIRTNNDLRDEHLRGDGWLDAARFPDVEFALREVSGLTSLVEGSATKAEVRGTLTVHGVARDVATTANVRLTQSADNPSLRIQASFPVKLEEHKVSVPSMVKLKVAPIIQVNVDLHAHAAAAPARTSSAAPSDRSDAEAPSKTDKKPTPAAKPTARPEPTAAPRPAKAEPEPTPRAEPTASPTPREPPAPSAVPEPAPVREPASAPAASAPAVSAPAASAPAASAPAASAPAASAPAASAPERKVDEGGCRLVSTESAMGDALLPLLAGLALWSQRRRARQR